MSRIEAASDGFPKKFIGGWILAPYEVFFSTLLLGARLEVEDVTLPGPELPDLTSDTDFHRSIQAIDLGIDS